MMLLPVSLIGHCLCHLFILFSNKFCLLMQSLLWLAALALASKPWQILQLCHFCQLIVLLLQKINCCNYCHSLLHWHCCQSHNFLQLLSPKGNYCFFYFCIVQLLLWLALLAMSPVPTVSITIDSAGCCCLLRWCFYTGNCLCQLIVPCLLLEKVQKMKPNIDIW